MEQWRLIYLVHNFFCIGFVTIHVLSPIYLIYKTHNRITPLVDCYPFDIYVTPVYHIMYFYQCCLLLVLVMHNVNWDQFLIGLSFFASSECDILCDKLRNLRFNRGEDMKAYDAKLVDCIKHHKKIRRYDF